MFGIRHASVIVSFVGLSTCLVPACGGNSTSDPPHDAGAPGLGGQLGHGGRTNIGGNGNGGTSASGAVSQGGQPALCRSAPVGTLCVVTDDGGEELRVGDPLKVTMRAEGCYSSSCTRLVSADCTATSGNGSTYFFVGSTCLATVGDACTDDCGGAPVVSCDVGVTLQEGEFSLVIGHFAIQPPLRFKVPSHLPGGSLCISQE